MEVLEEVIATVRASGIRVDEAVRLRSTNNEVIWLSPSSLVAKIAPNAGSDLGQEVWWAQALVKLGTPVVPLRCSSAGSYTASPIEA